MPSINCEITLLNEHLPILKQREQYITLCFVIKKFTKKNEKKYSKNYGNGCVIS